MKKLYLISILFLLFSAELFSEALFMPESDEVIELTALYTMAGRTLPANSYPVNRNILIKWADDLYTDSLSDELVLKIEELLEKLKVDDSGVTAEVDWALAYEQYFKPDDHTYDAVSDYLDEMPLGIFGGSFTNYQYGGACLELQLKREYSENPDNNMFVAKEDNPVSLENQIAEKGYVFFNNDFMLLIVGRLASHYGDPRFNSLMASDNLPFLDQVKLDMSIADFRLEYYAASLENRRASGDIDLDSVDVDYGENSIWTTMHRLVYSFDKVKFSLAEQSFICRDNNQLYLGDFFPLTVWHNAWLSNINISMFTDVTWTVIPGLELYFQWGFDDISASDVFGIADSALPTIDGMVFGVYHAGDIIEMPYNLQIEAGYTHYLWGSFDESNPLQEAVYRIYLDYGNKLIPFSSPYGPGAFWIELDSDIKTDFGLSGGLIFNYLNKNTLADLISTSYERADEEMAAAPTYNLFEIGADVNFNIFERFDFYLQPSVLHSFISNGSVSSEKLTWFECTLGGKISGHEVFSEFID